MALSKNAKNIVIDRLERLCGNLHAEARTMISDEHNRVYREAADYVSDLKKELKRS